MQNVQPMDALPGGLGDVVMVPLVKEARARGVPTAREPFERFVERGVRCRDGTESLFDAVVWCTGFRPVVGYGHWTGMASATLIGVMRSARSTAQDIDTAIGYPEQPASLA